MSYSNVVKFLKELDCDKIYYNRRLKHFNQYHNSLLDEILKFTDFLGTSTLTEKLYCFTNNIVSRPACKICDTSVKFSIPNKEYNKYCSQRCSMMDMKTLLGVENSSQLDSVKQKKKQSALEKYGVDNVSKSSKIKDIISVKKTEYWETLFKNLTDNLNFVELNLTEKEYYRLAWRVTNRTWRKYKTDIDPKGIRGKQWHLDHKVSVKHGYINNISPLIIGDFVNLELIPTSKNTAKSYRCSISTNDLIKSYNDRYNQTENTILLDINLKRKYCYPIKLDTNSTAICLTCGEAAMYFYEISKTWCCQSTRNSCAAMRKKNSESQLNSEKKLRSTQLRVDRKRSFNRD